MNTKLISIIVCVLLAVCATVGQARPGAEPEQIEFKFVWKQGQVIQQKIVSKTIGSVKMPDPIPEQKFLQVFEQQIASKCTKVNPDGSALFECTMPIIGMEMSAGKYKSKHYFDSTKNSDEKPWDSKDPSARIFSAMTKVKFYVTFDSKGRPTKVEGFSESMNKALGQRGDKLGFLDSKVADALRSAFNDDYMTEQIESNYRMFPTKGPVRVGDIWQADWKMKMPIMNSIVEGHAEYELLGIEEFQGRQCAKISIKESFSSVPEQRQKKDDSGTASSSPANIFEHMEWEFEGSGGEGIAYLDYENGLLVKLRQTQRLNMRISMKGDPNAQDPDLKKGFGIIEQNMNMLVSIDLVEPSQESDAGLSK